MKTDNLALIIADQMVPFYYGVAKLVAASVVMASDAPTPVKVAVSTYSLGSALAEAYANFRKPMPEPGKQYDVSFWPVEARAVRAIGNAIENSTRPDV